MTEAPELPDEDILKIFCDDLESGKCELSIKNKNGEQGNARGRKLASIIRRMLTPRAQPPAEIEYTTYKRGEVRAFVETEKERG